MRKPVRLAAPEYINALFDWIEAQVPARPAWSMPGPGSIEVGWPCRTRAPPFVTRAAPGPYPAPRRLVAEQHVMQRVLPGAAGRRVQCINAFPAWEAADVPRQAPRQHV